MAAKHAHPHPLDALAPAPQTQHRTWTAQDKAAVARARRRGVTWRQIAEHFDVSVNNIQVNYSNWNAQRGEIKAR
jgi:transposase-like protein